jgi:dipeptidyl aminopeptidase/acylaminoacyl peptidase
VHLFRLLRGLVAAALIAATLPTQAADGIVPVADFFRQPAMSAPRLSPDGTRLAMIVAGPSGRAVLAVAPVDTPDKPVGIAQLTDADVRSVRWVNDRRLVFDVIDLQAPLGKQWGGGLYAIDADGSDFKWLVGRGRGDETVGHAATRPLRWNHRLAMTVRDGSDDVVVAQVNVFDPEAHGGGSWSPMRLNTRTRGLTRLVRDEPEKAAVWSFDPAGRPLAVLSVDGPRATVRWRPDDGQPWQTVADYDVYDPKATAPEPVAVEPGKGLLVRAVRDDAAGTYALFRYDTERKAPAAEPMLALQGFDYDGGTTVRQGADIAESLMFDHPSGRLVGAAFTSDADGMAWFDPAMQALQARIDKLLPNTVNLFRCEACLTQRRFVVTSWSDRQPPAHLLFDREAADAKALTLIGASRPWIDERRMALQDLVRVPARDGASIPAYLTKPAGKGPWPTVVLVHGGPWVRGASWGWHPDSQFLASRGYLVIEPEYRGSVGYGHRWFLAGAKQWGLAMQDDVTDATTWAIAQGLADPRRIAIAGASYGGYATMMGLAKEPDLYRAGINWVGVTDIDLMYSISWSDFTREWQRYGMPALIGDRSADRAQLDRTSPLKRAVEITKPVLMAYGGKDRRVPLPHGTEMRDALKKAGRVEVEWIEYPDEGHGFLLEANEVDFWTRVERFLARHLQ